MAQEWTDGRLDELSGKVDHGFERAEGEIGGLRLEMRAEFTAMRGEMKEGLERVNDGLERVNDRIDSVQRTIAFGAVALTGAILAGFAAICTLLAAVL